MARDKVTQGPGQRVKIMSATQTWPRRSASPMTRPSWLVSVKSETWLKTGNAGRWFLPRLEATWAPKMVAMTSASPPQTIHSIERVGLFMIALRPAPGWHGKVSHVLLPAFAARHSAASARRRLGGVRGGCIVDQVRDRLPSVIRCALLLDPLSQPNRFDALHDACRFQQWRGREPGQTNSVCPSRRGIIRSFWRPHPHSWPLPTARPAICRIRPEKRLPEYLALCNGNYRRVGRN